MLKKLMRLHRDQRGITSLETAIILIAFVVVASVFAYPVLSAGIFSSEKGKEAIHAGLQQTRASMQIVGDVIATENSSDDNVDQIIFTVSNALGGEPINLITTTDADNDGIISDETTKIHLMIISYKDKAQRVNDLAWTATQVGKGDGDAMLESGEKFQINVNLNALSPSLTAYGEFTIELQPSIGSTLIIEKTIPAVVDAIMVLR